MKILPFRGRWQPEGLTEGAGWAMRDHTERALRLARKLRREMSLPEVLLWRILRQRPHGLKFRKQHPVGAYVADFFCAERGVIIEVDGLAHDMGDRPERDQRRDAQLREVGLKIVCIPASEVLKNVSDMADLIVRSCLAAPPPSDALRLPPPPGGEDFT
jgi:very-short-patch-repair endonuclease